MIIAFDKISFLTKNLLGNFNSLRATKTYQKVFLKSVAFQSQDTDFREIKVLNLAR